MINNETGYNGNPLLKKSNTPIEWPEAQQQEYLRCKEDPVYFAEKYVKIINVDEGFITIKLYDYQKEIIEKFQTNKKLAILQARQSGKTTTAVCVILHYILFNSHKLVGILANKADSAREVLKRIKDAYEALPDWLQQGIDKWNEGSIELENKTKVIAAATSSSAIRGKSCNLLYIDECVGPESHVCIESQDHYYYTEIKNVININDSRLMDKRNNGMIGVVYKTINNINNKEYIGIHRIDSHEEIICDSTQYGSVFRDGYLGSGSNIKRAITKYKPESFKQEVIFISENIKEASDMESKLVNKDYVSKRNTYNAKPGGLNYIQSAESILSKGEKISKWIRDNPDLHKKRMDKINKNPEKIEKAAAKHRGMKRSDETRKNISNSLKGKSPHNVNKKYIHNINTGEVTEYIGNLPDGWRLGTGTSNGPKNKKAFFNPKTKKIKFFLKNDAPDGWRLGRK